MAHMDGAWMNQMWWAMWIPSVLILGALLAVGIWAVRRFSEPRGDSSARRILEERFARGEIDAGRVPQPARRAGATRVRADAWRTPVGRCMDPADAGRSCLDHTGAPPCGTRPAHHGQDARVDSYGEWIMRRLGAVLAVAGALGTLAHALNIAFGMTWEILWALVLGLALSGAVQAVVSKAEMTRLDAPRIA